MIKDMYIQYKWDNFSLVVKSRGQPPNRWKWEIYRAGRATAVEQSATFFPTVPAAHKAGKAALARLFKEVVIRHCD